MKIEYLSFFFPFIICAPNQTLTNNTRGTYTLDLDGLLKHFWREVIYSSKEISLGLRKVIGSGQKWISITYETYI